MKKMGTQAALLAAGVLVATVFGCSDSDDEYYYTYSETDVTSSQGDTTGDEVQEVTVTSSGDVSLGDLSATVSSSDEVSELVVEGYSCTGSGYVWLCQQEADDDSDDEGEGSVYVVTLSCDEDGTWSYTAQGVSPEEATALDESDELDATVVLWLSEEGDVLFVLADGSVCEASEDGWLWEADDGTTYSIVLSQGEGGEWTYTLTAAEDDTGDEDADEDDSSDSSSSSGSTSTDSSNSDSSTDDSSNSGDSDSGDDDSSGSNGSSDSTGDNDSDDSSTTVTITMSEIIESLASNITIVLPASTTEDDLEELIEAIAEGEYTGITLDMSAASQLTSLEGDGDNKVSYFNECSSALVKVILPEDSESVGAHVLRGCENLTTVVIPDGVTSIGAAAFKGCTALTSVTLPDGLTTIGNSAFCDCTSLSELEIPDTVTSIGTYAFQKCAFTSFVIPDSVIADSVTNIGKGVFYGCASLTSVSFPSGITSIVDSMFYMCTSLSELEIPDTVTSIGTYAFQECAFTSFVIPDSVTNIEKGVFYGCASLTSVSFPSDITSIAESMFYNCTSLTSIEIPSGVTSIGTSVFRGCTSLESVTMYNKVESIGEYAFYNCTALQSGTVTYYGTEAEFEAISIGNYNTCLTGASREYKGEEDAE